MIFCQIPDEKGDEGNNKADDAERVFPDPGSQMSKLDRQSFRMDHGSQGDIDPAGETENKTCQRQ